MADKKDYTAEDIKVLEGLEGIRKRPSMYIGSTGKEGLHHLIYEVVDNSVDEALAGFCTKINVTMNKNGSVTIEDDGRGIPVENHPIYKVPAVQIALTKLHAGGKFDKKSYAISGGLHGVGVSCVNALSRKLIIEIKRDGKNYVQEYSRGNPVTKLKSDGNSEGTGTTITFWPDEEIFSTIAFDYKTLETRFREITFLNPGLKIVLKDEIKNAREEFFASGGLIEFVKWINKSKEVLHKPVYFKRDVNKTQAEIAIQYNMGYQENIFGFVNTINTVEGGTHVSGFKTALTRVINDYANKTGMLKNDNLMGDDVREGLTAIISIKIPEPQFEGQTKTKLGNSEIRGLIDSIVTTALSEFFEENPAIARKIASKALESAKARLAAKKAKDLVRRKNAFSLGGLPGKLADCSNKKSENTELYLVEGESAGGCFSGDTKVALVDGRNLSFKEIVEENKKGKQNFCYTINEKGNIEIAKIKNPRMTRENVSVIKIVLDNNQEIICTPDHKFMLRDKKYKEAKDLTKEDSLMPLNRKLSKIGGNITIDGYEMVWDNNKWIFTHLLSDKYNLREKVYTEEQGQYKHHIDFNKLNNNPTNIIRMQKEDHLILHTENLAKTLHREDVKQKANTMILMKRILEKEGSLNKFDEIRIKDNNKNILSLNTFCNRFFKDNYGNMLESVRNYNHKIKKIEFLSEKRDVYDLEVPKTHNFALASGIFVHNSAKMARNKEIQAILPLKGKILNVEKANPSKALSSEEITNMITVIGTGIGEQFDSARLRYGKIIIMTDADVDGEHIKTLLLTFFFRFMPQLIENGNVYAAMPPLYRIRKGQKDIYVYSDAELKKATNELGVNEGGITRFKGLGEMSATQLWDTTMNPNSRKIKKIYIEDAIEADKVFSMLMGDDVQARKEFIEENAKEANLDI